MEDSYVEDNNLFFMSTVTALPWPARKGSTPLPSYWHQCPTFLPITGFCCFALVSAYETVVMTAKILPNKAFTEDLQIIYGSRLSVWVVKAAGFEDFLLAPFLQLFLSGLRLF